MALSDYEETLQSYIHDEDKLVTYKWLSKEFEIHVNAAKDILKQYWEKFKNKECLAATILLIGQLKDRSIRVEVVKESNLSSAKEKFVKIDCEHFYSLQKTIGDLELLASSGEDLRYSAIKCSDDNIRNDEEIDSLRYIGNANKGYEKNIETNKTIIKVPQKELSSKPDSPKKKSSLTQNDSKEKTKSQKEEKISTKKQETKTEELDKKVSPPTKLSSGSKTNNKTNKKPVQSKQSGFNNLFGKSAINNTNKASIPKKTEDSDNDSKNNSKDHNKQDETQEPCNKHEKNNKNEDKQKKKNGNDKNKSNNSQEKENKKEQSEEKSKKLSNKVEKSSSQQIRGKKRKSTQDTKSTKRKRIIVESSEDDSNQSDNEIEEPMEIEEEPPKIVKKRSPSPPSEKRENGKRMVRKTVSKTFQDEDGFLVTKKVHVYEAASDNDEPETTKEEAVKPKVIESKAKKQTSLMSFFKKS